LAFCNGIHGISRQNSIRPRTGYASGQLQRRRDEDKEFVGKVKSLEAESLRADAQEYAI
jgi:hypothetical protein